MIDLRSFASKKRKAPEEDPESKEARAELASKLEGEQVEGQKEIRKMDKTSYIPVPQKKGSIFDFLLEVQYSADFFRLLELNQELVDPGNEKSKLTKISQKKFLVLVKSLKKGDEDLQKTKQSTFYKWLCRNGLGTSKQIANYYKSRSKEIANKTKRRVIIEELVTELGDRPELIEKLFTYDKFREGIRQIIKEGI